MDQTGTELKPKKKRVVIQIRSIPRELPKLAALLAEQQILSLFYNTHHGDHVRRSWTCNTLCMSCCHPSICGNGYKFVGSDYNCVKNGCTHKYKLCLNLLLALSRLVKIAIFLLDPFMKRARSVDISKPYLTCFWKLYNLYSLPQWREARWCFLILIHG